MRHNIVARLDIKVIIATRLIKMKILLRDTWRKKFKIRLFRKRNKLSNSSPNRSYESFFAQFQSYSSSRRKKVERSSIFTKQRTSTEGGRQLIRKKGDEQTGCSFLPLVDKSYEGAVNMRTLVLHLVGRLRNIDGESSEDDTVRRKYCISAELSDFHACIFNGFHIFVTDPCFD